MSESGHEGISGRLTILGRIQGLDRIRAEIRSGYMVASRLAIWAPRLSPRQRQTNDLWTAIALF
ncbi:MAG: hypothetical protein R3C24_18090 [Cyanobacteriota/Melainabacteria group bacterium]